jgi:hypothetical protein
MSDAEVRYRVRLQDPILAAGTTRQGMVTIDRPAQCGATITVEWGEQYDDGSFTYQTQLLLDCGNGVDLPADASSERAEATAKLANLGYRGVEYETAVVSFQCDYELDEYGLDDGRLPETTRDKLWAIYQDGDASYG